MFNNTKNSSPTKKMLHKLNKFKDNQGFSPSKKQKKFTKDNSQALNEKVSLALKNDTCAIETLIDYYNECTDAQDLVKIINKKNNGAIEINKKKLQEKIQEYYNKQKQTIIDKLELINTHIEKHNKTIDNNPPLKETDKLNTELQNIATKLDDIRFEYDEFIEASKQFINASDLTKKYSNLVEAILKCYQKLADQIISQCDNYINKLTTSLSQIKNNSIDLTEAETVKSLLQNYETTSTSKEHSKKFNKIQQTINTFIVIDTLWGDINKCLDNFHDKSEQNIIDKVKTLADNVSKIADQQVTSNFTKLVDKAKQNTISKINQLFQQKATDYDNDHSLIARIKDQIWAYIKMILWPFVYPITSLNTKTPKQMFLEKNDSDKENTLNKFNRNFCFFVKSEAKHKVDEQTDKNNKTI